MSKMAFMRRDHLDNWSEGFVAGQAFSIEAINNHCGTQFKDANDVIAFIRRVDEYISVVNLLNVEGEGGMQ